MTKNVLKRNPRLPALLLVLALTIATLAGTYIAASQGMLPAVSAQDALSIEEIRAKAEANDPQAQHALGLAYRGGKYGLQQDFGQAAQWLRKAADQGVGDAQNKLGLLYEDGQGVQQDYSEALALFRKAADSGRRDGMGNVARMYHVGIGVEADLATAAEWYRKAAELNSAQAQFNLGYFYHEGQGVPQSYEEAAKLYAQAAEQNFAPAQANLALMYAGGQGIKQDLLKAGKLYALAAQQGQPQAQDAIEKAKKFCPPREIPLADYALGQVQYCLIAAGAADNHGLHRAGQIFYWGHLVERDVAKGIELTAKAAEAGYDTAAEDLKLMKAVQDAKLPRNPP